MVKFILFDNETVYLQVYIMWYFTNLLKKLLFIIKDVYPGLGTLKLQINTSKITSLNLRNSVSHVTVLIGG